MRPLFPPVCNFSTTTTERNTSHGRNSLSPFPLSLTHRSTFCRLWRACPSTGYRPFKPHTELLHKKKKERKTLTFLFALFVLDRSCLLHQFVENKCKQSFDRGGMKRPNMFDQICPRRVASTAWRFDPLKDLAYLILFLFIFAPFM